MVNFDRAGGLFAGLDRLSHKEFEPMTQKRAKREFRIRSAQVCRILAITPGRLSQIAQDLPPAGSRPVKGGGRAKFWMLSAVMAYKAAHPTNRKNQRAGKLRHTGGLLQSFGRSLKRLDVGRVDLIEYQTPSKS